MSETELTAFRSIGEQPAPDANRNASSWELTMHRVTTWLKSPRPYLMLIGFAGFIGFWYLSVEVWKLPRFAEMPGPTAVITEWFSKDPTYGLSIFVDEYYLHIWVSTRRIAIAFFLATVIGVPLGLFLGWSPRFKQFVFPVFELLRPIPPLAWVPLAIVMFHGSETPVIFLTFLASFYATALNTMLGVESIDEVYFRAARSLGFSEWAILRHVVVPGALPYIFVGLQIAMAACWFSLVASEIVSGTAGLGYKIWEAYYYVQFETMTIMMVTLGICGYVSSSLVRRVGDWLMRWRGAMLKGMAR